MRDQVTYGDIERAAGDGDPHLAELVVRYLAQDDPPPGRPEPDTEAAAAALAAAGATADDDDDDDGLGFDDDDDGDDPDVPAGAFTLARLRHAVTRQLAGKGASERKLGRREAWAAADASPWLPPRLRLGKLLIELYEGGDDAARAALVHVFRTARLGWGSWQAAKRIYKLAEERHDLELFAALAYRFDVMADTLYRRDEIGAGTVVYLRRRAWRWLRHLGQAVPDAYPVFAAEVLRHYGERSPYASSWIAAHIWGHRQMIGVGRGGQFRPPSSLDARAFPDTWKLSPVPLLRLLAEAGNDLVCDFAIRSLRADHDAALRAVEPAWLARLGRRTSSTGVIHDFVVSVLRERPELHMSRLREVGLHEVALGFLHSPGGAARAYAVEYARAHAPDLAVAELVELAAEGRADVVPFVSDRLTSLAPAAIGLDALIRLLGLRPTRELATAKLTEGFRPGDLDAEQFTNLITGTSEQRSFATGWYDGAAVVVPAGHWIRVLADPRCAGWPRGAALTALSKRTAAEIGVAWIRAALDDDVLWSAVARWLEGGMLAGDDLDVDWVKDMVAKPRLRALALYLLGNRALVAPARIGLDWLLAQSRSADPQIHGFAHRMLLEHFTAEDFGAGGDRAAGLERLWALAAGRDSREPERAFAATYLKAHHPGLGPELAEARALGITPRLTHDDYPAARIMPLFDDERADVRRLAAAVAGEEITTWGDPALVYRLAASRFREARQLGCELLLDAVDGDGKLPADWLDGARLFALAEAAHKATRETALTIIRRAYQRVGGAARLAWLMESAERDVRLFAVRLFWDRHRPRATPPDWQPRRDVGAPTATDPLPPGDEEVEALRQFVRTVLYGLPPGRLERRDVPDGKAGRALPERPLSASVAKRRLVEAVRDLAVDDVGFAAVVAPVLAEFAVSAARGEWQACVAALARIRRFHPGLGLLGLPAAREGAARGGA